MVNFKKGGQIMKKILKGLVVGTLVLNLVLAFGASSVILADNKPIVGNSIPNDSKK